MNRLKMLRKNKKESLAETSANLEIPYQTYRNYEVGKRTPKVEAWRNLAEYFNVSVPYIMGIDEIGGDMVSISKIEYERLLEIENKFESIKTLLEE